MMGQRLNKVLKASLKCTVLLAICFALSVAVRGISLDSYSRQVERAHTQTDDLINIVSRPNRDPADERGRALAIVEQLPVSEKIEWQGGSLETNNIWLDEELGEFSKELSTPKGKSVLIGVSERLQAINASLKELQAAHQVSGENDKQKLAEILSRSEYQKPKAQEESLFQKWLRKFWEWLAKLLPSAPMPSPESGGMEPIKLIIQILVCLAVVGLLGLLAYKFFPLLARNFRRGTTKETNDRVILGERVAAEESAHDLFAEAEGLARQGNLREAIRKGYIAVLCDLSDRKIIGLARYKTNRDYLRDVRQRSDLFENLSVLTGSFERNWYGLRQAGQTDWEDFRDRYRQTVAKF